MAFNEKFKKQHDELLMEATQLSKLLNKEKLMEDSTVVREHLSILLKKLNTFLTSEAQALFPSLKPNQEAANSIQNQDKAGGLEGYLKNYSEKWLSTQVISYNTDEFRQETSKLIADLTNRIKMEKGHLF